MATTWLRTTMSLAPSGARGMATLKDIETRLKSVKNIKKITSSMKMVSAAKFTRAEKALKVSHKFQSPNFFLSVKGLSIQSNLFQL